jgi:hypothetical protein
MRFQCKDLLFALTKLSEGNDQPKLCDIHFYFANILLCETGKYRGKIETLHMWGTYAAIS